MRFINFSLHFAYQIEGLLIFKFEFIYLHKDSTYNLKKLIILLKIISKYLFYYKNKKWTILWEPFSMHDRMSAVAKTKVTSSDVQSSSHVVRRVKQVMHYCWFYLWFKLCRIFHFPLKTIVACLRCTKIFLIIL